MTGIVLSGGKSTRFGLRKAEERLVDSTLLERVLRTLSRKCTELIVVTAQSDQAAALPEDYNVRAITDVFPEKRPLGGLYAGLRGSSS